MSVKPGCPQCEYALKLFTEAGFDMSKVEIQHPSHELPGPIAAYGEMKKRGWGFARNRATGNYAVGPMDDLGFVLVKGIDPDFVKAMEKAIERVNKETDTKTDTTVLTDQKK